MDKNQEYFEKFIIKQIVGTVDYHPDTGEYEMNRLQISDDIINRVVTEGARYGLEETEVRQFITYVAGNIRTAPYTQVLRECVAIETLRPGQHIRINLKHPLAGMVFLDMMALQQTDMFFLLDTNISGLRYGDRLLSINKTWHYGVTIDFIVHRHIYRGGTVIPFCESNYDKVRIPDDMTVLRVGKVDAVELLHPSVIHEILDSQESFALDGEIRQDAKDEETLHYAWGPAKEDPISFLPDDTIETGLFIIAEKEGVMPTIVLSGEVVADIIRIGEMQEHYIEIINSCCKPKNEWRGFEHLKGIKTIKCGVLKTIKGKDKGKEWILVKKPIIKYVYG